MPINCTPAEAAALVRPVDRIGFGLGPANPDAFLSALGGRDDWEDLVFGGALLLNYYDVLTKPGVSYRCGFFGPAERILLSQGHRTPRAGSTSPFTTAPPDPSSSGQAAIPIGS
jgi:hypothetical protein